MDTKGVGLRGLRKQGTGYGNERGSCDVVAGASQLGCAYGSV